MRPTARQLAEEVRAAAAPWGAQHGLGLGMRVRACGTTEVQFATPAGDLVAAVGLSAWPDDAPSSLADAELDFIETSPGYRRCGHAWALLRAVCEVLDRHGIYCALTVCPYTPGDRRHASAPVDIEVLGRWYRRAGFRALHDFPRMLRRPGLADGGAVALQDALQGSA